MTLADDRHPRRPGWCNTHNDFAWIYTEDGSISCMYCYVVEISSSECVVVPMRLVEEAV